ncbi:hypothetical protein SAMN04488498_11230 [Mesorhizobium albiziae]|uniref:Uncharacterized protein n=1 Tax=Neomesorhizobium albiziae TaxID=335020 RepID=A0A1I4C7C9_9HYPH|nr:hypothetical protein [Mesorhizobium albiziae]GLS29435.1 hypothetical protein GCM10007937_11430 [Mesorhizobium albiziae]SFK76540.1 hypothetical protein SAMN04488498_11230 [Mesorhizobium albiziae]
MRHIRPTFIAVAAVAALFAGSAGAACPDPDTTASINDKSSTGIAKDGTHAPLENDASAMQNEPVKKDGKTMPLATEEGGGNKNLATSQQDIEAQQKGDQTAAAKAEDDACKD